MYSVVLTEEQMRLYDNNSENYNNLMTMIMT